MYALYPKFAGVCGGGKIFGRYILCSLECHGVNAVNLESVAYPIGLMNNDRIALCKNVRCRQKKKEIKCYNFCFHILERYNEYPNVWTSFYTFLCEFCNRIPKFSMKIGSVVTNFETFSAAKIHIFFILN